MTSASNLELIWTDRGMAADIILNLPHGLHSRPSAKTAQTARKYRSNILLIGESGEVDAKSMLDILSLAAKRNDCLRILANGPDAFEAVSDLAALLSNRRD